MRTLWKTTDANFFTLILDCKEPTEYRIESVTGPVGFDSPNFGSRDASGDRDMNRFDGDKQMNRPKFGGDRSGH